MSSGTGIASLIDSSLVLLSRMWSVVVIHLMVVINLVVVWVIEQMTMEKDDNAGKSHVSNYPTKVRKTITDQLIAPAPIIILFYTSQSHPHNHHSKRHQYHE